MPNSGILREILIGGLILGGGGVLFGTWLATAYGHEQKRAPTAFALLFFWIVFGVPGFVIGSILGGVIHVSALALQIDLANNLSSFVIGGLYIMAIIGFVVWRTSKRILGSSKLPASRDRRLIRFLKPPKPQHRPIDLQVEQTGPPKIVTAVCNSARFSPDSRWLLANTRDRTIVWDTDTFGVRKKLNKVTLFEFSQDSLHLAVYQPSNGRIQVIELESGRVTDELYERSLPPGKVESLYFSPKEPSLDIKIRPPLNLDALDRYDRIEESEVSSFVTRPVFGRRRAPEHAQEESGEVKASRYTVKRVWRATKIHDTSTKKTVYSVKGYVTVHLSQDSQYALIIAGKHSQVIKLPEGELVHQIEAAQHPNAHLGYSLPHTVWILDRNSNLLIDGVTGETAHRLDDLAAPRFPRITLSSDMRYVAGIDQQGTLRIQDLDTDRVITHTSERYKANSTLIFSPDSTVLLVKG
jgi:WD40 repeat protein